MINEQLLKTSGAVQKFYRLRKNSKNLGGGGGGGGGGAHTPPPPPPPHTGKWGLKQNAFVSLRPDEEICLPYLFD